MRRKLILLALLAACSGKGDGTVSLPSRPVEGPRANELPPVPLNPNSPVDYPPTLAAQGIEGTVLLRLMVDTNGTIVRDSTRVAESSGYPALDSAAMQAVPSLRYAPAERDGAKVAMAFLQPIYFRTPQGRGVTP
jgi:TonB family protein